MNPAQWVPMGNALGLAPFQLRIYSSSTTFRLQGKQAHLRKHALVHTRRCMPQ